MPFTISHAGFVLPFKKVLPPAVLCGLMIGSIVPDFGYFVREFVLASFAHTVMGALCVSLPAGLAMFFLMRLSFGRIARVLPSPHSSFLMSWGIDRLVGMRTLLTVAFAIFIGALSHNFIDSFTHQSGAAVSLFPMLSKEVLSLGGDPLHVFRILQYLGSAIGMAIIIGAYCFGLSRHCRSTGNRIWQDSRGWLVLIGVTGLTVMLAVALNAKYFPRDFDFYAFRVFGFKFLITWLPIIGLAILCLATFFSPKSNSEQGAPSNGG
jgi:hypothetical protein